VFTTTVILSYKRIRFSEPVGYWKKENPDYSTVKEESIWETWSFESVLATAAKRPRLMSID
jgi:hypothetical protein